MLRRLAKRSQRFTKRTLRRVGINLSRYDARRDPANVRMRFFKRFGIDVVLDVGANVGQYASRLRDDGYQGRIVSFEPLSAAFGLLATRCRHDDKWTAIHVALGDRAEASEINISRNSYSSSLLAILPNLLATAPETEYVGKEQIRIELLDDCFDRHCGVEDKVFLKIDTQGFTNHVLRGATKSLDRISGLQVELSLVALYEGEPLIGEVIAYLERLGFRLVLLISEFTDAQTGQQLQVDGIFFRL